MTGVDLKRKAGELPNSDSKKPKTNGSITSFFGAPKSTSSKPLDTSPLPSLKFDKAKWASSLTSDQRDLLSLEIDTLDPSWLAHLKEEIVSKEFLELKRFLKQEKASGKTVLPPPEDIYSWSRYTPLNTVKVVIIGQDPYHNLNQAHGLCFSVRPPTTAPPSLNNMYKALKNDYPTFVPPPNRGGLLTPWAERGVLLLNTCLTVRAHEANSHANRGWEKFTGKVIEIVDKQRRGGVVFLAWGSPAGKRVAKVDRKRHNVLMSVHPSPLSAARGFFDCGHFKKTNVWLKERYGEAGVIDWDLNKKVENKPKVKVGADAVVEEKPKIGKDELASKAVEAKDINKDPVKVSIEEATHSESKGDVANVSTDDLDLDEALLAEAEAM